VINASLRIVRAGKSVATALQSTMTDHEDAEPASVGAKNAKGERGRFRSTLYLIFHVAPRIAPDVTVFNTLPGPGR